MLKLTCCSLSFVNLRRIAAGPLNTVQWRILQQDQCISSMQILWMESIQSIQQYQISLRHHQQLSQSIRFLPSHIPYYYYFLIPLLMFNTSFLCSTVELCLVFYRLYSRYHLSDTGNETGPQCWTALRRVAPPTTPSSKWS